MGSTDQIGLYLPSVAATLARFAQTADGLPQPKARPNSFVSIGGESGSMPKLAPLSSSVKMRLKRIQGARTAYHWFKLKMLNHERLFTEIARANGWGGRTTTSGWGSDPEHVELVIPQLSALLRRRRISSLLDVPCGEFSWMRFVDLSGLVYIGADIVKELIERNREYQSDRISFRQTNIMTNRLPTVDLILCRDCLVHFCYRDIYRALTNICSSGSTYILVTTFPDHPNRDIATGDWQPLNLEAEPFNFPPPLERIVEGLSVPQFADKSMALWRIAELNSWTRYRPG